MDKKLIQKNNFVIELRDYLQEKYKTSDQHTYGSSEFEARKVKGSYCLVRKSVNTPEDISGFCFRKDLCSWPPRDESQLLKDVKEFASRNNNLEAKLEQDDILNISFGEQEYLVTPHIDGGHAGEISVYFANIPNFSVKLN